MDYFENMLTTQINTKLEGTHLYQRGNRLLLLKDSSHPVRMEMQELSLEEGPSRCTDPPAESAVLCCSLEISRIHGVSDIIRENALKIDLK